MIKTPLYEKHIQNKGKMIEFGGFYLPVQYEGIITEHKTVRNYAGIFDVSHMGEFIIKGPQAEEALQKIITNDINKLNIGRVMYTPLCNESGGTVDDVLIYKKDNNNFMAVVNAANINKDFMWIKNNIKYFKADIYNVSHDFAQIAIQGPMSEKILNKLSNYDFSSLKFYSFIKNRDVFKKDCIISRTGYTGEDGFEIYMNREDACDIWDIILDAGFEFKIKPCGLGARNTLRLEACLPLYGHELTEGISPYEAGLNKFICFKKDEFIGKQALLKIKQNKSKRKLIGFKMIDRGIPRNGYEIFINERKSGLVTSGSFLPCLNGNFGVGLIDNENIKEGDNIKIGIRKNRLNAKIVKLPFYKKNYKK